MAFGLIFILTFPILAIFDIGQSRTCENWTWYAPATIFVFLAIPFILGYFARNPNDRTIIDDE